MLSSLSSDILIRMRFQPILPYNKTNLKKVSRSIVRNLTQDLLPKKFWFENGRNPMYGHCHNASGCLYKIFGSTNVHLYRAKGEDEIWHWWVIDKNGTVIDLTESQYSKRKVKSLHSMGSKAGLLGFDYKKRVLTLLERVRADLGI